ncbi:MAG: hypothetical protein AB7T31_11015 [Gemmatimonadales bacterium]
MSTRAASLSVFMLAAAAVSLGAQGVPLPLEELPLAKDIPVASGQTVTPAYEGWYENAEDGSYYIVFGYYSRNAEAAVSIPVGPDNQVTGAPDAPTNQPTRFEPGRHWGVFAVRVPQSFDGEVVWTLKNGGRTFSIPGGLDPLWKVDAISGDAMGNHPPRIRFSENGPTGEGPFGVEAEPLRARVGEPLEITVWGSDDGVAGALGQASSSTRPFTVHWFEQSGPGTVTFAPNESPIAVEGGSAVTTAEFSAPGDYVLRVTANDASGVESGGHAQCCWTNGYVKVTVEDGTRRSQ